MKKKNRKKLLRRLLAAEAKAQGASIVTTAARAELSDLREKLRRLDVLINGGVLPMINDLAQYGSAGTVEIKVERDEVDVTELMGEFRTMPAREEYSVTYESVKGHEWVNGKVVAWQATNRD